MQFYWIRLGAKTREPDIFDQSQSRGLSASYFSQFVGSGFRILVRGSVARSLRGRTVLPHLTSPLSHLSKRRCCDFFVVDRVPQGIYVHSEIKYRYPRKGVHRDMMVGLLDSAEIMGG